MESFQQPAFAFQVPNTDFDPNEEPSDGEQYLQRVFLERSKCPQVVVSAVKANNKNITEINYFTPAIVSHFRSFCSDLITLIA